MNIDVKDLPPAYQAQALRKLIEQERKKGRGALPSPATAAPEKAGKYHNKPTERVTPAGSGPALAGGLYLAGSLHRQRGEAGPGHPV